jgi:hypothetical protein
MERLFSPCTRLHDLLEGQFLTDEGLQELNLDVSTEELLSAERAFTFANLDGVLGNEHTAAWLTPHAAVARIGIIRMLYFWEHLPSFCYFRFSADGKEIFALARSSEHLLEICDVVLRLLAASAVHSVKLYNRDDACMNAPTLAYLMENCQSLKALTLEQLDLDENHCRVLGDISRPDLEIELCRCKLTSAGISALTEVLERNQGPTKLDSCEIECSVLANGLRGNSRLKSLTLDFSEDFDAGNREILAIANAFRENKGLVKLYFRDDIVMSDEAWGAFCDSLKTHPTLEILNLPSTHYTARAAITSRIQALLEMMKSNLSIHTIHLSNQYSCHELFRGSVFPYLETNRLRPRLLAIQKTRPTAYRAKVLGRALLATRTNANSFWMLLLGNAEMAFPSRTATIAAAANLPTPATTSVMSSLTTTATASLSVAAMAAAARAEIPSTASASDAFASTPTVAEATAANVDTPSAGQKRKARP